MTKQELEQLISLRKEIEELEQDIQYLEQMDIRTAPIKVDASSQVFPYMKNRVTIQGYDPILADRRDRLLCEKMTLLCERKKKAAEEENHLLQYINDVKESRVRRILQYRYVEGYSWEKIGCIMHFDRRTGERIVSRYLKRNKK